MAHIEKFPFADDFEEAMLSGRKWRTSRNKKYGEPGDTFDAFGKTFVLTEVRRHILAYVKMAYWQSEGCSSPQEFVDIWKKIHPRKGFVPDQSVWVHTWNEVK
ncbi:hypothetical protein KAR91_28500 [Candidatus Pacearchaeota archaeon]|nr:hypothetical protein [Candidatus Pacearchaeota archaeon]